MISAVLRGTTALPLARSFWSSAKQLLVAFPRPSPKHNAERDPRKLAKRIALKKAKNRVSPQQHPLYMDIPTAMKYMRASEVGKPASRTTVSLQIVTLPEKGSTPLRGEVVFPKSIKSNYPLIFTQNPTQIEKLEKSGKSFKLGGEELINEIKEGTVQLKRFTQCFASPEMAPLLRPIARDLGVKGLMPSTKKNTVGEDILGMLERSSDVMTFRQKRDQLYIPVGRCDFSDEEIIKNIKAASEAVYALQPPGTKSPNLIGQCTLSSTNGPAAVIDFRL